MDLLDIPKSELMDRSTGLPKINSNDGSGCVMGFEKKSSLSSFLWNKSSGEIRDTPLDKPAIVQSETAKAMMAPDSLKAFIGVGDTSFFSSSLPATFHKMSDMPECIGKVTETGETGEELLDPLEEMESRMIRSMLPDDDELLAGIVDGFDNLYLPNSKDESEDFDLFSSVGGLELDGGPQEGFGRPMNRNGGLDNHLSGVSEPGSVIGEHPYGEHPYGEHPSRTLFVRNINSNVEDAELQALFEQYGDIRTLYTACKHRGFVMVSYYDIRAARSAIKGLHNKPLRHRNLDIHFSIPKDNPSDKDINQGTLVVFNLDASVSNDVLRQIFGAYGEVKEIRETPHKRHHKFVEFYDVRDADAALRALNKTEIAGKRIKVEPSRPGGARRSLMQMLSQELEQEEICGHLSQVGSPVANSPPGYPSHWSHVSSPVDNAFMRGLNEPVGLGTIVHSVNKPLLDLSVTAAYSSSLRVGTIGSHLGRGGPTESNGISGQYGLDMKQVMGEGHHPHSFPEYSSTMMPFGKQVVTPSPSSHAFIEGLEGIQVPRTSRGTGNEASLFEHSPGAIGSHISSGSLTGSQFLWGNSNPYHESVQSSSPGMWSTAKPVISHGHSPHQSLGYSGMLGHFSNMAMSTRTHHHHVGSAPTGDLSAADRHYGHFGESPDVPFLRPGSYGTAGIIRNNNNNNNNNNNSNASSSPPVMRIGGGHLLGTAMGMILPQRGLHNMFQTTGSLSTTSASMEGLTDHGRLRSSRTEYSASQHENKKQYLLDLERIAKGEDTRTTLMIKNIPNKYTSKMLLATIDEKHRGTYDFLYLPIDFKNKCNVGYAFINMTFPCHIVPFYETFNGKKWDKFNSEKVASLAYARIQGKSALVAHFQNSSLMNEDKRCRPILFRSHGPEAGEEEPFPSGLNIRPKSSKDQNASGDFLDMPYILTTKDACVPGAAFSFSPESDQN